MMQVLSKVVGIVQIPTFQHHFLQFLTLVCLITPASASIVEKVNVQSMTHEANQVQIGEVVSTWVSPDDDLKMYFTYVKIRIEQTLKGQKAQEILLRQPGGSYYHPVHKYWTHQKVHGMQSFKTGERGLFFIKQSKDGAPTVMFQGKHVIEKDQKTGLENVIEAKEEDHDHQKSFYAVREKRPLSDMVLEVERAVEMEKGDLKRQ